MKEQLPKQDPYEAALQEVLPREIAVQYAKAFRDFADSLTHGGEIVSRVTKINGKETRAVIVCFNGIKEKLEIYIYKSKEARGFKIFYPDRFPVEPLVVSGIPLSAPIFPIERQHTFCLCAENGLKVFLNRREQKDINGTITYVPDKIIVSNGEKIDTVPR